MSRFEKFINKQVFTNQGEPLNENLYIHDGIIVNFENGYISNWYCEQEKEMKPAIDCVDAHIEYWENGLLNRNDGPAVISNSQVIFEYWIDGKKQKSLTAYKKNNDEKNFELGKKAEIDFAKYLNKSNIPFIHLDQIIYSNQPDEKIYSLCFNKMKMKSPDYIIFINKTPIFIDVKAILCNTINQKEIDKLNALENEYSIKVFLAIKNSIKKPNNYLFLALENLTKYVNLFKNKKPKYRIFNVPEQLLTDKIELKEKISNNELSNIVDGEIKKIGDKYFQYSDILMNYLKNNNYQIK